MPVLTHDGGQHGVRNCDMQCSSIESASAPDVKTYSSDSLHSICRQFPACLSLGGICSCTKAEMTACDRAEGQMAAAGRSTLHAGTSEN